MPRSYPPENRLPTPGGWPGTARSVLKSRTIYSQEATVHNSICETDVDLSRFSTIDNDCLPQG